MNHLQNLSVKIESEKVKIGVIGLGYVGLPLVVAFAQKGFSVLGFDVDRSKIERIDRGESYIRHIAGASLKNELISATSDMERLGEVDVIVICVPTPLSPHREPDLSYVIQTTHAIARCLRAGQLVILESTTYPGTTAEVVLPILASTGLIVGSDFGLAYSPEREDPGNGKYCLENVPKVVGGTTPICTQLALTLYDRIVEKTVPVSSTQTAEATKILENIYRAVNIALVNELKVLFQKMDINIWEVIEAAKTKPFGFQAFYPGPGWGGHCIPIDPFYLTWKAKEYEIPLRFVELAGEVNAWMPDYVVNSLMNALNDRAKAVKNSRILVLGVAYKKNVDDQRESPSLKIIQLLKHKGAQVAYHDPYAPTCNNHRHYPDIDLQSVPLTPAQLQEFDAVIIATDHDNVDYQTVVEHSALIIDTRNILAKQGLDSKNTVLA
jgi:UDP-N-acetyl-D-glucosamine dehydrogenase